MVTRAWLPHPEGRELLGAVPDGVVLDVWTGTGPLPDGAEEVAFLVPPFLSTGDVLDLPSRLPALQVVQLLTAGAEVWVDRMPPGVALCDGRGVHDSSTSEWVVAALLACCRRLPHFVRAQAERHWDYGATPELAGRRVLVVGAGSIGAALRRRLEALDVEVVGVARRARDGVLPIEALPGLLPDADAVVLLVPLTPETRGLVDAAFLARMRDGALLVNAARGPVVDTDALVAELSTGRLRAALDVTDPEPLPPDHPLWTAPGLELLTPHVAGSVEGLLPRAYALVGRQLTRFAAGEPLDNVVTDGY